MGSTWKRGACSAAVAAVAYRTFIRPREARWGATDEEAIAPLLGDDLVAEPAVQVTRAITIDATPAEVWPWMIQIGADRGGFYSYDWLENIFRLGIHSADRIVPEWQERAVGDLVCADAKGSGGWYVMEVEPDRALVLKVANRQTSRPLRRDEGIGWEFSWTFALNESPNGPGTRLLVRERVAFGNPVTRWLFEPVGLISFAMTRKMMMGIRARAERR